MSSPVMMANVSKWRRDVITCQAAETNLMKTNVHFGRMRKGTIKGSLPSRIQREGVKNAPEKSEFQKFPAYNISIFIPFLAV